MTGEDHNVHVAQMVIETDLTVVGVLVLNMIIDGPPYYLVGGAGVLVFIAWFQSMQARVARRRYERAVKEHLDAGGVVMMVRQGRRFVAVPLPIGSCDDGNSTS